MTAGGVSGRGKYMDQSRTQSPRSFWGQAKRNAGSGYEIGTGLVTQRSWVRILPKL